MNNFNILNLIAKLCRNITSCLKFTVLCVITLFLIFIVFFFKTFQLIHILNFVNDHNHNKENNVQNENGESARFVNHPRQGAFFIGQQKNFGLKRIDWHNYKQIEVEANRKGIGEHGIAEHLSKDEKEEEDKFFSQNGFNALLSDRISLNRSVPDIRHKECKNKRYLAELPTVSVIVPFYNEHWSTLLRTVYSVLNRSPKDLIKEIILVDDHSKKEFLKEKLDRYVEEHLPKVKVIRLLERQGLITARLAGAKIATGDVLIFLDSHTEANVNWLPPLLEPIALDYRVSVCPFIDVVAYDTFQYRSQDEGARGAFDWNFFYKRLPLLPESKQNPTEIFESPVMAGGLFAISTKFFWELGGYDEGLDIWGGEQYELSFKIWQCGGKMYDAPCSRVGHIYRGHAPFENPRKTDYLTRNYKRVAEVWMDEYKNYLYDRRSDRYANIDAGDLSKQKAIREKLKCKSFKWFMENVAFDLPKKYPPVEPPDFASGAVESIMYPKLCVDTLNKGEQGEIGLYPCADDRKRPQTNQFFALSWHKDIRRKHGEICWDVPKSTHNAPVLLINCHGSQGNQLWRYDSERQLLIQGKNNRCLEADGKKRMVYVNECDASSSNMKWKWGFVNETALKSFDKEGARPEDEDF